MRGYLLINSSGVNPSKARKDASRMDAQLKRIPDDCMDATAGIMNLADNPELIIPTLRFF